MPLTPASRLGPYEILSQLGAGGMGEVYRARDVRLGREVAVKVLLPELSANPDRLHRFEQEAKVIATLSHPNLLQVFDTGIHEGTPYLVMELLEGRTLRRRMEGRPLPARKVVELGLQIAQGLAAAHGKGITHRDLKPENIFITVDERLKILDFGLAKLQAPISGESDITREGIAAPVATHLGAVMGTVGYMSPEQVAGRPADPRSDIFALGVILWEMLTGQRPFQGEGSVEILHAILKDELREFPPTLQVPVALERIITRCLSKEPQARFQTAQDLAFALEGLSFTTLSSLGPRLAFLPRFPRLRLNLGFLLLGAALLLGLAFWGGTHLAGAPIAHLRQLTYHHAILQNARFAPDGQSFVFTLAGLGEAQDYYLGRLDGVGARPLAMPPTSHLLALSRLGDMALLVKRPGDAEGTLCRAPLTGGAPREIQEGVRSADWSPDGQELAVLKVAADGHLQVEYPLGTVVYEVPTMHLVERIRVSPTGDRVAFAEHAGLGRGFLSVVDRKGRRTVVVEGKCDSVLWSPSGDELVYTVRPGEDRLEIRATTLSGRQRLLHAIPGWAELLDMSSTGQILLGHSLKRETMALRREDAPEEDLSWLQSTEVADLSRDGRTVLFGETREGAGPGGMYVRRIGEKDATRLGDGDPLALSPDGRWAVAKLIGQPVDLLMVPTGSGRPRRVSTGGVAADWVLFATPTRLVLGGAKLGSTDFRVYVLDLEGGPLRTLPTAVPREAYAVVSLDGQSLALAPVPGGLLLLPLDGRPGRLVQGLSPAFTPIHWTTQPDQIFVGDLSALPARICRFNLLTGHLQEDSRIALTPGSDVRRITYLSLTPDGKTLVYSYGVTLTSDLFLMEGWR